MFKKLVYFSQRFLTGFFLDKLHEMNKIPVLPTNIDLAVEGGCFFKCKHCDIWKIKKSKDGFNFGQQKEILQKLKKWTKGRVGLTFSGGEPFLNPKTIALIRYASELGFYVSTNSNGFLINSSKAKEIIASGLKHIAISLDSPRPKIHNYIRGNSLAYSRAIKAVKLLKKYSKGKDIKIEINTVIMKQNIEDLEKLVKLVDKLNIEGITFQPIYETFATEKHDSNWYKKSKFWPKDTQKVTRAINNLIDLKKRGFKINNSLKQLRSYRLYFTDYKNYIQVYPCYVGATNFLINGSGEVRLCWFFNSVGNILKQNPEEIWNNAKSVKIRKKCRQCKRGCRVLLCNSPFSAKDFFSKLVIKMKNFFNLC